MKYCIVVLSCIIPLISLSQEFDHRLCTKHERQIAGDLIPQGYTERLSESQTSARIAASLESCNSNDFSSLSSAEKIEFLKSSDYECLRFLFTWDSNSTSIFSKSFITTVFDEYEQLAPTYDGTNSSGLFGLLIFVHTAIFHEFYQNELSFDDELLSKYETASQLLAENDRIFTLTNESLQILSEFLITLDFNNRGKWLGVMSLAAENISSDTIMKLDSNVDNYYFTLAFNNIYYYSFRGIVNSDTTYIDSLKANDKLVSEFYRISLDTAIWTTQGTELLLENAILEFGRIGQIESLKPSVVDGLKNIFDRYPRLSKPWFNCIAWLEAYDACSELEVCADNIRVEVEEILFPNSVSYDEGQIVFQTEKSKEDLDDLYFAIKEVQAQFFRMSLGSLPLTGDANDTLIIKLYPSRSSYEQFHNYLYGLPTNNGGIYIESDGTFYTYDRTPNESIYSLEDLLRHEYVHYLQGRYLIDGLWGNSEYYGDNRLVWFEEGMAEFLVGATPSSKVKGRRVLLDQIVNDQTRLTTSEITNSSYSDGFKFYRYSGYLFKYFYDEDANTLLHLNQFLKTGRLESFDSIVSDIGKSSFNSSYQNYLTSEIEGFDSLIDPVTNYPEFNDFVANSVEQISRLSSIKSFSESGADFNASDSRFSIQFEIENDTLSENLSVRFEQMDSFLNKKLKELASTGLNNLSHSVGYIRYDSLDRNPVLKIEGPLRDSTVFPNNLSLNLIGDTSFLAEFPIDSVDSQYVEFLIVGNSFFEFDSIHIADPFSVISTSKIILPDSTLKVEITFKPDEVGEFEEPIKFILGDQIVFDFPIAGEAIVSYPPISPSNITLSDTTDSSININWTDNSDDEDEFIVEKSIGDNSHFELLAILSQNSTEHTDIDIEIGNTYFYRIMARNQVGFSEYSDTVQLDYDVPVAPSNITLSDTTDSSISIIWSDNSDDENEFILEKSIGDNSQFELLSSLNQNGTEYTDQDIEIGNTYFYRIMARNQIGFSEYSDTVQLDYDVPIAPSNITLSDTTDSSISIIWSDNSDDEDEFILEKSIGDNSQFELLAIVSQNGTEHTDLDIEIGNTYFYRVMARNQIGFSEYSDTLSFIMIITGIEENISITVYPNPSSGKIFIDDLPNTWSVQAFDMSGQQLEFSELSETNNQRIIQFQAPNSSVIFLNLIDKNRTISKKIILSK